MNTHRFTAFATVLAITAAWSATALGQDDLTPGEKAAPTVLMMQRGATGFLQDLQAVMNLTTPAERKEWPNLKDNLEVFLIDVNRERPMRLDYLTGNGPLRYRFTAPVTNAEGFRENNLSANGITISRKLSSSLYRLTGQTYEGFLRLRGGYASFSDSPKYIPYELPNPETALTDLLEKKYDFAIKGFNQPGGQAERRKYYEAGDGLRAELMGTIIKRKDESAEAWESRRMAWEHQLDVIGQLYVEAERLVVGANVKPETGIADFEAELKALPDTELGKNLARVGTQPGRFAGIPLVKDNVMSLQAMLPLSPMWQENLREQIVHQRDWAYKRAAGRTSSTAEQQAASRKAADLAYDIIDKTIETGWADVIVDSAATTGGFHRLTAGLVIADGSQLEEFVTALANSGTDREVKLNAGKVGPMSVHQISVSRENYPWYHHLVGQDTVYIGTHDKILWVAGGEGSLDRLQELMAGVDKPAETTDAPIALQMIGRFGPWLRVYDQSQTDQNATEDPQIVKWRRLAIAAATVGDDQMEMEVRRTGDQLRGTGVARTGLLRFLGKLAADFSKTQVSNE